MWCFKIKMENQSSPKRPPFRPLFLRSLSLCLSLGLLVGLSACQTVASFYQRPRPASYYTTHYCFEVPRQELWEAAVWLVETYHLPLLRSSPEQGLLVTKPVQIAHLGNDPDLGYTAALHFRVEFSQGPLDLQGLPMWAIGEGKQPATPEAPQKENFPSEEAYLQAQQRYQEAVEALTTAMSRGVALGKTWQGCRLQGSLPRARLTIDATLLAYPLKRPFYTIDLSKPPKPLRSDRSLEYTALRRIGKKLGRLRFMPPLLRR